MLKAIDSVPHRPDIEIIVIDDCSTDDTLHRLKTRQDIRLFYNTMNMGVGYTVNQGINRAKGEYIVQLDSDDYFTDNFLTVMDMLDGTDMVYFDMISPNREWKINESTKRGYCGAVKFIRRAFIGDTRCPQMRHAEDWHFYRALLAKTPTEVFTGITVKHYNYPRVGSLTWELLHEQQ